MLDLIQAIMPPTQAQLPETSRTLNGERSIRAVGVEAIIAARSHRTVSVEASFSHEWEAAGEGGFHTTPVSDRSAAQRLLLAIRCTFSSVRCSTKVIASVASPQLTLLWTSATA